MTTDWADGKTVRVERLRAAVIDFPREFLPPLKENGAVRVSGINKA